jgi:hypothetical protein
MWKPIETAPKDGTDILAALLYRDGGDGGVQTIRWHEPWGQWVMAGCLIGIQNNVKDDENCDPTHWMPLPQSPHAESDYDNAPTDPHHGGKIWNPR